MRYKAFPYLLSTVAACVCVVVLASPALASRGHVFERSFGGEGSGDGQFSEVEGVAVNEATGDVYVVDRGNSRVEYFSSTGTYLGQFNGSGEAPEPLRLPSHNFTDGGIAVDNACQLQKLTEKTKPTCKEFDPSNGDVYVETGDYKEQTIDKFSSSGAYITQIAGIGGSGEINGVAVDPRGDLWIEGGSLGIFNNATINEFREIQPEGSGGEGGFLESGLAVDSNGDFYIQEAFHHILEYNAKGEVVNSKVGEVELSTENGIAVELSTNDVYLDELTSVGRFGPVEDIEVKGGSGRPLGHNKEVEDFGAGHLLGGSCNIGVVESPCPQGGIAVSSTIGPANGRVYVARGSTDEVVVFGLEPPATPVVQSESVSDVTSTGVTFQAEVNPRSEPNEASTSYRFEYGTCVTPVTCATSGYEQSLPVPDGQLSPNYELNAVSARAEGLLASTEYHYRVTVTNAHGSSVTESRVFTTQGVGGPLVLPDGRKWELVSPPDKFGAAILPIHNIDAIQASLAGDAITYAASAPIEAQPPGNSFDPQVLSLRGSAGWESRDIAIPHEEAVPVAEPLEYLYFSEDLSHAIVQPYRGFNPMMSREASEQTPYLRTNFLNNDIDDPCTESCYRPLVTGAPGFENVPSGTRFGVCEGLTCGKVTECPPAFRCGPQFQGASPDLDHIVVKSRTALTEGSAGGLYEWSGGMLTSVAGSGVVGGESVLSQEAASSHAVSRDGSRVIVNEGNALSLHDTATEEIAPLDEPLGPDSKVAFQTASSDESKIFFTNGQGGDLEECEIVEEAGHLHCVRSDLTPGAGVFAPILGASEDGSSVYFVSNGVLSNSGVPVSGAVQGTCQGEEQNDVGALCNLYVRQNGVTKLVAVLSGADVGDWGDNQDNHEGKVNGGLLGLTGRVSPDGDWLAFMSQRSLTGYDNRDAVSGQPDEEVYLYDAAADGGGGKLVCASCNPTGAPPHGVEYTNLEFGPVGGQGVWGTSSWLAASVPGWTTSLYQSRYLSDSGRLFFNSSDGLVPQDPNNTEDVYEYEPVGVGDCGESSSTFDRGPDGCVALISSGSSPEESGFLDASENGDDVFFMTTAKLAAGDLDSSFDVYDAHVCSISAPCAPPPGPPAPPCVGDACQSPVSAPEDPTPDSLTFSGPGNFTLLLPTLSSVKPKAFTRAQKLVRALHVCHAKRVRRKRVLCESRAQKRYGSKARRASEKERARS